MTEPNPPAGWYPDPDGAGGQRYFDGTQWTDRTPPPPPSVAATKNEKEEKATPTIIAGYVFAVLIPLVGFIIGLTQINRNKHGIWVVVLSCVAFLIFLAVILGAASESCNPSYEYC